MANEKRLISADRFCDFVDENCTDRHAELWKELIRRQPNVDAVEVVHGEWVKHKPKPEAMRAWHRQGIGKAMSENSIFWTCSCCEEWGTPRYNYCPNCGAKMDGEMKDNESVDG